jgi:type II secretory pathway pseudopilin PulG
MIVSVGLFAMVMLVATAAYFNLIALDRRARATNQVVNNLNFAVDAMVRGIRTGTGYTCLDGTQVSTGNWTSGDCTQFSYTDTQLPAGSNVVTYFRKGNGAIGRNEGAVASGVDSSAVPSITDPSISITSLTFYVRGAASTDDAQPQVLFTVKGTLPADSSGTKATFTIEEDATGRLIDL